MLKFDGEKWELYKKKVSYLAPYSFYTDEVEVDSSWVDVEIETLELTEEQQKRLGQVSNFENAGIDELTDYILHDIMPEENKLLHQHIELEKMKELLKQK